ncbi:hypothetical protein, partial [Ferruginibacter sp.]|uniref:hypothetical protein n=1 Tax=Ferruginibacter sp. TaxID=1940288 RepID=UPI00374D8999
MKKFLFLFLFFLPCLLYAQTADELCITSLNNGFESPKIGPQTFSLINAKLVPNWTTTASDNMIEIWSTGFLGVPAFEGNQFAELNANEVSTLIKSFTAKAGAPLTIKFAHRGRLGVDVMQVSVGPEGGPYLNLGIFSDDNTSWQQYIIPYTPLFDGPYQLRFISVSAAGGNKAVGNFLDGVDTGTPPIVVNIATPPIIVCGNVALDGSASTSGQNIVYSWTTTNGNIVSGANNTVATVSKQGTYVLTVKNTLLGCSNFSSVNVIENPLTANAGADLFLCGNTSTAKLSAVNPYNTGVWSLKAGSGAITTPTDANSTVS